MENLRKFLNEHDVKHSEFAKRLGISKEYMSRIVNGHKIPSAPLQNLISLEVSKIEMRNKISEG